MGNDYGIRITHLAQHGPLWQLSPRALRLWLYLAMKAQHAVARYTMADGQKVTVSRGQWLTSRRKLQADAGYHTPSALLNDLKELAAVAVITVAPVMRERFESRTASGSKNEPGGRFGNRTSGFTLATLITVNGLTHLAEVGGSKSEPKERERDPFGLSRDNREWERVDEQLKAEGR